MGYRQRSARRYEQDAPKSHRYFTDIVWPILVSNCPVFKGHSLCPVEHQLHTTTESLDIFGGIDFLSKSPSGTLLSVAARVQWVSQDYRSFTIRAFRQSGATTEFAKRLEAISQGGVCPYWWVHAYVNDGSKRVRRIGVVKTREIIDDLAVRLREDRTVTVRHVTDEGGEARFFVLWWTSSDAWPSFWEYVAEDRNATIMDLRPTGCARHPLYALTDYGDLRPPWVLKMTRYGKAVVCSRCGKFYGYMRK